MKSLISLVLLSFSSLVVSAEKIDWINKSDELTEGHKKALSIAKNWASKFYENENDIAEFHYLVRGEESRKVVSVLPVYSGGYVLTDGEMCLTIVNSQELISAKQCIAP
ncbi:hypothetical protein [Marinobacter lipolyticus]|uniref:hypothetical protein n=1 Tax=Marinobacter lipolyticus TaxID=209639 RepID=UPI003A942D9A